MSHLKWRKFRAERLFASLMGALPFDWSMINQINNINNISHNKTTYIFPYFLIYNTADFQPFFKKNGWKSATVTPSPSLLGQSGFLSVFNTIPMLVREISVLTQFALKLRFLATGFPPRDIAYTDQKDGSRCKCGNLIIPRNTKPSEFLKIRALEF